MAVRIQRTPSSSGSNSKFTFSCWVKRATLGALSPMFSAGTSGQSQIVFDAQDELAVYDGGTVIMETNRKFRDPNGFYHIVVTLDATQSGTDKAKLYVNGVQETSFATDGRSSFSSLAKANQSGEVQDIGSDGTGNFLGLMTHVHMTDNYAYQASTFGETDSTSEIWVPKTSPSVTYGTNGFFLKFENSGNLDLDSSSNGHTFSTTGTLLQTTDTPTNNFCTLNALDYNVATLSNGNNEGAWSQSAGTFAFTRGTIGFGDGKYYWEVKISSSDNSAGLGLGVVNITGFEQLSSTTNQGNSIGSFFGVGAAFSTTKAIYKQSNNVSTTITGSWANDDIIGIAYDGSTGKIYMKKNDAEFSGQTISSNTSFNDVNLTAGTFVAPYWGVGDGGSGTKNVSVKFNWGAGYFGTTAVASANADANGHGAFEYAPPSGYYAICTQNLKEFG